MDLRRMTPLVIYDDRCYLCIKFANIINALAGRKIRIVGHYTETGRILRERILDSSALEMFWFVDKDTAFGGRAALLPLIKTILFAKNTHQEYIQTNYTCDTECKNVRAVFVRSASILSHSKRIKIDRQI